MPLHLPGQQSAAASAWSVRFRARRERQRVAQRGSGCSHNLKKQSEDFILQTAVGGFRPRNQPKPKPASPRDGVFVFWPWPTPRRHVQSRMVPSVAASVCTGRVWVRASVRAYEGRGASSASEPRSRGSLNRIGKAHLSRPHHVRHAARGTLFEARDSVAFLLPAVMLPSRRDGGAW